MASSSDDAAKGKRMPLGQNEHDNDVVVVATAADDDHDDHNPPIAYRTPDDEGGTTTAVATALPVMKGEVQPPAFRDVWFSVLFFIQVAAIAATAMAFGPALIRDAGETDEAGNDNQDSSNNWNQNEDTNNSSSSNSWSTGDSIFFLVGTFLAAALVVMGAFRLMIHYPLRVIQVSFFVAPITFGVVALLLLVGSSPTDEDPNGNVHDTIVGVFWGAAALFSLFSLCFYFCYKRFMPFAAINLKVALSAVRANAGLFLLGFGALFVVYAWSLLWLLAFGGIVHHDQQKEQVDCSTIYDDDYDPSHQQGQLCDQQPSGVAIVLLLLCLYWTQQVIQNTVHTTTAGAVSSWWVQAARNDSGEVVLASPHRGGCCGPDVSDSLYRACTYSFGSICFGSLLTAILQTLEQMARNNRNRRDLASLIIQCLIICLRAWLEYFNSWAFCYVGIYGYDYLSAGRKVIELFKARGWTTFITDRLVFRVLLMANLGIAAVTGALSVLIVVFLGATRFHTQDDWAIAVLAAFWIGFVVGLLVSNTVLFVVESSVRTIMVCFAEQPADGPMGMLRELQDTYAATYPGVFVFTPASSELHDRSVV